MSKKISSIFLVGVLFLLNDGHLFVHGVDLGEGELGLTNTWAVELDTEDENVARDIAKRFGYDYGGKVGSLPRHFIFTRTESDEKHLLNGPQQDDSEGNGAVQHKDYKRVLEEHPNVMWAERQMILQREKQIEKRH